MQAGKLNKYMTLESPPAGDDGQGGKEGDWVFVMKFWGGLREAPRNFTYSSNRMKSLATHAVDVRFNTNFQNGHRITYGTRVFEITSITNIDEADRDLLLGCEER